MSQCDIDNDEMAAHGVTEATAQAMADVDENYVMVRGFAQQFTHLHSFDFYYIPKILLHPAGGF
jgi:hypothetical protein